MQIKIKIGKVEIFATLKETATAGKVLVALPFTSSVRTWGEEVYFQVPVSAALMKNTPFQTGSGIRTVLGTSALLGCDVYGIGNCLALPYGRTPISKGTECRLADRCNILGELEGDFKALLRDVRDGDVVNVERI